MAGELITRDLQIQWAGQLWGDGTVYAVQDLPGWEDLPGLDDASVPRSQQIGAHPGALLAQSRSIACTLQVVCEPDDWPAARRQLFAATAVRQEEQPLVVQLAGEQLLVQARITRRVPTSTTEGVLGAPAVALLWEASDPRRYQVAEQSAQTALPADEAGLPWGSPTETGLAWGSPAETGLTWGTPGSTGDVLCVNSGDAPAHPVIEIRGPVTRPSVAMAGTGLVLEYDIVLAAGDVLIVDTWAESVELAGQDRLTTATLRSAPETDFVLPPGAATTLSFRAAPGSTHPAAQATVRWRSAYW
ncbi:hypothetical protein GCM10009639_53990 [Kitasatospora putterlickiae]|uniref:Phage tail protein n=1 Tax=Kitasatospora putterlickiae TaxID=221725 RepID=A0ABP4J3E4_9ACTN